jgi:hypothetical protein
METINSYLDSIFLNLPQSDEIKRLKADLQDSMGEKYVELKSKGKSENEAIGIVISEFGNIDEILNEMGVQTEMREKFVPTLNQEQAKEYISLKSSTSKMVGFGVSAIIIGAAILASVSQAIEDNLILTQLSTNAKDTFPAFILFIFLVPAIALFIYSSYRMDHFKFVEKNQFQTDSSAKAYIENLYPNAKSKQTLGVIIGVSISILSAIPAMIANMISDSATSYGGSLLLLMIATAVFLFITTGSVASSCKQLLQIEEYAIEKRKENKMIGIVAGIVWPLAVCIFFIIGFVFNKWEISWVVFPITGILFGGFCAAYTAAVNTN